MSRSSDSRSCGYHQSFSGDMGYLDSVIQSSKQVQVDDSPGTGGGLSQNGKFSYGYASSAGKRSSMEDFYETRIDGINGEIVGLFGVFDGHGGARAAEFVKQNLFSNLIKHPSFISDTKSAIADAYSNTDTDFLNSENTQNRDAGSTASTAILVGDRLVVANVGDSRAVICRGIRVTLAIRSCDTQLGAGTRILAKMAPKRGGKVVAAQPRKKTEKDVNPLYEKRPKQFGIGGALPPKKDMRRFVKWPKVVQIQRKRRILKQRLKVPPALNQFTKTLDKNLATSLFKMLLKYRPEDKAAKKERLLNKAQADAAGKDATVAKKPIVVKYGLKHVTYLIEQNKAQLVVIAHDVDPIELVVWLPALCRKMEIPYCIVKGKARLGSIVHKKTASVLCLTTVKNEDKMDFSKILEAIKANFNDKYEEFRKKWGGGIMGSKSQAKTKAKERVLAKEAAQRMT